MRRGLCNALCCLCRVALRCVALCCVAVIMTSDDTHAKTVELLEMHRKFGAAEGQISIVKQEKVPALSDNDAHFAMDNPFQISTKPHGHGLSLSLSLCVSLTLCVCVYEPVHDLCSLPRTDSSLPVADQATCTCCCTSRGSLRSGKRRGANGLSFSRFGSLPSASCVLCCVVALDSPSPHCQPRPSFVPFSSLCLLSFAFFFLFLSLFFLLFIRCTLKWPFHRR